MNFEEFKKRYFARLDKMGAIYNPNDGDFIDRIAEIYMGILIFNEWQIDEAKKAQKQARKEEVERIEAKHKARIYAPNGGIIQ